jgi:hypothetical protein
LVLPQYTTAAKLVYEEFCDLMKCKTDNDYDTEMLDSDDATQHTSKTFLKALHYIFWQE